MPSHAFLLLRSGFLLSDRRSGGAAHVHNTDADEHLAQCMVSSSGQRRCAAGPTQQQAED